MILLREQKTDVQTYYFDTYEDALDFCEENQLNPEHISDDYSIRVKIITEEKIAEYLYGVDIYSATGSNRDYFTTVKFHSSIPPNANRIINGKEKSALKQYIMDTFIKGKYSATNLYPNMNTLEILNKSYIDVKEMESLPPLNY